MSKRRFSRRAMLVSAAGTALALPYMASWRNESGSGVLSANRAAASDGAPKRFALWVGWWGTMPEWWSPLNTSPDGTSFELNKIMEPLAPLKSKMSVISGVNPISLFAQMGRNGSHNQGAVSITTGGRFQPEGNGDPDGFGGKPWSLDPHVVSLLARKKQPNTKFESMLFGDWSGHDHGLWRDADGRPLWPPIWYPELAFDTLFRDFAGNANERELLRAGRKSVLDALLPGYQTMRDRLASPDRQVLEEHMTAIRDLELRSSIVSSCEVPQIPSGENPWRQNDYYEVFGEIMARAFACNLTNFLTFGFNGDRVRVRGVQSPTFDAINPPDFGADVHAYGHAGWRSPENNRVWGEIHTWRMKMLAHFCKRLDEMQDVDGSSVLDNSCVMYTSEIATGLHDIFPMQEWGYGNPQDHTAPVRPRGVPTLYLGGLGNRLKTGRHFEFDRAGADRFGEKLGKYSITEVYLAVARAMGIEPDKLASIGMPEACSQVSEDLLV